MSSHGRQAAGMKVVVVGGSGRPTATMAPQLAIVRHSGGCLQFGVSGVVASSFGGLQFWRVGSGSWSACVSGHGHGRFPSAGGRSLFACVLLGPFAFLRRRRRRSSTLFRTARHGCDPGKRPMRAAPRCEAADGRQIRVAAASPTHQPGAREPCLPCPATHTPWWKEPPGRWTEHPKIEKEQTALRKEHPSPQDSKQSNGRKNKQPNRQKAGTIVLAIPQTVPSAHPSATHGSMAAMATHAVGATAPGSVLHSILAHRPRPPPPIQDACMDWLRSSLAAGARANSRSMPPLGLLAQQQNNLRARPPRLGWR
jgi:hypothetical protein